MITKDQGERILFFPKALLLVNQICVLEIYELDNTVTIKSQIYQEVSGEMKCHFLGSIGSMWDSQPAAVSTQLL